MTTKKISEMETLSTPLQDTDVLPIVRLSDPSPASRNKKVTIQALSNAIATRVSSPSSYPIGNVNYSDYVIVENAGVARKVLYSNITSDIATTIKSSLYIDSTYYYNDGATISPLSAISFTVYVGGANTNDFVVLNQPNVSIMATASVTSNGIVNVVYYNYGAVPIAVPQHTLNLRILRK